MSAEFGTYQYTVFIQERGGTETPHPLTIERPLAVGEIRRDLGPGDVKITKIAQEAKGELQVRLMERDSLSLYGLADSRFAGSRLGEVVELFVRREDAERALADVLADEPTWRGQRSVVTNELVEGSGRTTSEPL